MTTSKPTSPQDEDTSNGTTTVRFVSSIASGVVEDNTTTPSLTDFNALVQQTQNMQERMDALEKIGLLQNDIDEKDDPFIATKRNSLKEDVENANQSTRRRTLGQEGEMTESAVEAKYDEYELPESTYSLLMTEKIMSIPFFTGILSVFLSLFALVLALKNELDNGETGNFLGKQIAFVLCISFIHKPNSDLLSSSPYGNIPRLTCWSSK